MGARGAGMDLDNQKFSGKFTVLFLRIAIGFDRCLDTLGTLLLLSSLNFSLKTLFSITIVIDMLLASKILPFSCVLETPVGAYPAWFSCAMLFGSGGLLIARVLLLINYNSELQYVSQKTIRISSSKKNKLCRSWSETVFNDFFV